MSQIIVTHLPVSGAIVCYNEDNPVTAEEMMELDGLLMRMRKVFAVSSDPGIIEEDEET